MPVEDAADRAEMLSMDDFGIVMTWTPSGGGAAVEIVGIFDNEYEAVLDLEPGPRLEDAQPLFSVQSADVAAIARGDELVRQEDGRRFIVREFQQDGTGMTALRLQDDGPSA